MSYEVLAGCKLHMAQLMSLSSQNLIRNQNGFTFIVPDFSGRLGKVTINTHTHTRLTALFPKIPGIRKVKPIRVLLKQETVSGSGIAGSYASVHLTPDR